MSDFIPTGMSHSDFFIGCEFMTGSGKWRCTDIGTRVIVAICLDDYPNDPSWYNGPPYAVSEHCLMNMINKGVRRFPCLILHNSRSFWH